jgi:hypothetical protein
MVITISKKTTCALCGEILDSSPASVGFPAFVPKGHKFAAFSDSAFHQACFQRWEHHAEFEQLFRDYQRIWESRPKDVGLAEAEEWGRSVFNELFAPGM